MENVDCKIAPAWFFINLDSSGKMKQPCVISSIDENGMLNPYAKDVG
jgi:hypothetical protein